MNDAAIGTVQLRPNGNADGRVFAIVVSFNPDRELFVEVLAAISSQVTHIVVVDNASQPEDVEAAKDFAKHHRAMVTWIDLRENVGLAAAQNIGCRHAMKKRAEYVVLFDQDSVPDEGMVAGLRSAAEKLRSEGKRVGAVGPRYRDPLQHEKLSHFVTIRNCRSVPPPETLDVAETDFLISSGMMLSAEALTNIGMMDSCLFIDHIDTEWCLRARSLGYRTFGVHSACMTHTLGAMRVAAPFCRSRKLVVHRPERYYFMVRNGLLLLRRGYVHWRWRIFELRRLTQLFIVYGLLLPQRKVRLAWMVRGLLHGLLGRSGPIRAKRI
jgi:rhamnosyltransferase